MNVPELDNLTPEEVRPLVGFFLRDDPEHTEGTLQAITEIIGAAINLKPATMHYHIITPNQARDLQDILTNLHLNPIVVEEPMKNLPPGKKLYYFFASRKPKSAKRLQGALYASRALGWCPDSPKDQELTYRIGRLLGYPETAARYCAYGPHDEDGIIKHRPDADRDRYYIHSPEHFRAEYEQFEDILHPAVSKFAPIVANEMRQKTHYLWTSADL